MGVEEQRCIELAREQWGVLHYRQALVNGFSRWAIHRRIRNGEWNVLFPQVYRLSASKPCWEQQMMGAVLWARGDCGASHLSAAAVWGLPGFERKAIDISAPDLITTAPSGITVHNCRDLRPIDIVSRGAMRVTTIERTLLDVCGVARPDRAELAVDAALRMKLTTKADLKSVVDRLATRGRPGSALFRQFVLERLGGLKPAESPPELEAYRLIQRANLPLPVRQHQVWHRGMFVARIDLAYPDLRLGIEVDSFEHHSSRIDWERDRQRDAQLSDLEWRLMHVTTAEIRRRPAQFLSRLQLRFAQAMKRVA
jgi:hypothetical protein